MKIKKMNKFARLLILCVVACRSIRIFAFNIARIDPNLCQANGYCFVQKGKTFSAGSVRISYDGETLTGFRKFMFRPYEHPGFVTVDGSESTIDIHTFSDDDNSWKVDQSFEFTGGCDFLTDSECSRTNRISMSSDGNIVALATEYYNGGIGVYNKIDRSYRVISTPIEMNISSFALSADGSTLAIAEDYNVDFGTSGVVQIIKTADGTPVGDLILGVPTNNTGPDNYRRNKNIVLSISGNGEFVAVANNREKEGIVNVYKLYNETWIKIGGGRDAYTLVPAANEGTDFGIFLDLSTDGNTLAVSYVDTPSTSVNVNVYALSRNAIEDELEIPYWSFRQKGQTISLKTTLIRPLRVSLSADGNRIAVSQLPKVNSRIYGAAGLDFPYGRWQYDASFFGMVKVYSFDSVDKWRDNTGVITGSETLGLAGFYHQLSGDGKSIVVTFLPLLEKKDPDIRVYEIKSVQDLTLDTVTSELAAIRDQDGTRDGTLSSTAAGAVGAVSGLVLASVATIFFYRMKSKKQQDSNISVAVQRKQASL